MNHLLKINKQNVIDNIKTCANKKDVCLMVKANTYGLGDDAIQMLIDLNYNFFGVSTLEEALHLRALNSEIKILIVSYIDYSEIEICIENNITFTVYSFSMLEYLSEKACFHLKIDTNMGRLGFQLHELSELKKQLVENNLKPEGIFSHLACASQSDKTQEAIENFKIGLKEFEDFDFKYIHLLNSFGSLNYETHFDNLVRIGIGIWGYLANQNEMNISKKKLKPALSLDLSISHVKDYSGYISYDHLDYVDGQVLTVPLGYNDGYRRTFKGYHIKGVGKVVGNINMCQHMILTDTKTSFKQGDMFSLFKDNELYELCDYANITTYEFLVGLSNRLKRRII